MNRDNAMERYAVHVVVVVLLLAFIAMILPYLPKGTILTAAWPSWGNSSADKPMQLAIQGAAGTLTITAVKNNGGLCDYNAHWDTASQIFSQGSLFACTEEGYQGYITQLAKLGKIGKNWIIRLRIAKFWP